MAYNRKTHEKHAGVSIVKRRGAFWLKWRLSRTPGDYRSAWERLPDEITSREAARTEAIRKADEVRDSHKRDKHRRKHNRPRAKISEALTAYTEAFKLERVGRDPAFIDRTLKSLSQQLKPFNAALGATRCERLTLDDLEDFRARLGKSGNQPRSINRVLDAARAAMNFLRRKHYVSFSANGIGEALAHFDVTSKRPRVLDRAELRRLITALAAHDGARWKAGRHAKANYYRKAQAPDARNRYRPLVPFVVMGLLTGARPGELEALRAEDVREGHGNILVRASKTDNEREVPWHDSPLLHDLALALKLRAGGADKPLIGNVKRARVAALGLKAGIDLVKDAEGNAIGSLFNRQCLRRTCVAHVAAGSTEGEGLLAFRFGHGMLTSIKHYRQALHNVKERGATVEAWLGVERELRGLLVGLGYIETREEAKPAGSLLGA